MPLSENGLAHAAERSEQLQKVVRPMWAIVVGLLAAGWVASSWWAEWRDVRDNGSPIIREFIAEQKEWNRLTGERLKRMEERDRVSSVR